MCRRVTCEKCHKPTYAGCGAHIEQVLADVAPADRCKCREQPRADAQPKQPAAREARPWWKPW